MQRLVHWSHVVTTLITAAGAVALGPSSLAQGDTGFLRGAGRTDTALSYAVDTYDEFWIGNTRVKDPGVGEVTRESINLYIGHGLDDNTDLFAVASYVEVENDGFAPFDDERALQDAIIGVKHSFHQQRLGGGDLSVLAAPSVKIPMSHYEANSVTAIGDGQIDYRIRGIVHFRADCGVFVSVESGFDYRTESPRNEIPLNVTAGITVFDRVTIMPFYSIVESRGGYDIGQGDFPGVEEESERWGVSLYARITEALGLTLGWKTTIDGENTGDVDGYWGGVVFRF